MLSQIYMFKLCLGYRRGIALSWLGGAGVPPVLTGVPPPPAGLGRGLWTGQGVTLPPHPDRTWDQWSRGYPLERTWNQWQGDTPERIWDQWLGGTPCLPTHPVNKHLWKHYLPHSSDAGGKYTDNFYFKAELKISVSNWKVYGTFTRWEATSVSDGFKRNTICCAFNVVSWLREIFTFVWYKCTLASVRA